MTKPSATTRSARIAAFAVVGTLLFSAIASQQAQAQPGLLPTPPVPGFDSGSSGSGSASATPRFASLDNFRDVAGPTTGYLTADGKRVASGVIYRSNALTPSDFDYAALQLLGVTTVYDLRSEGEIDEHPDRMPASARYSHVPILTDGWAVGFIDSVARSQTPEQTREAMHEMARTLVTDDGARTGFQQLLTDLANTDGPHIVHCSAGKDRTGWATAILLSIAGVPRETILSDYLLTNEYSAASIKAALDEIAAARGDDAARIMAPLYGVEASYLDAGFAEVERSYGSFDNYVTDGLGLDRDTITALRAKLVH